MRKKKAIIILVLAGFLVFGLWGKFIADGRHGERPESTAREEELLSGSAGGQTEPGETEAAMPGNAQEEPGETEQGKVSVPERILPEKPVVKLNGKEGELSYRWAYDGILANEDTLLFSCDCLFKEEKRQQKLFFLAKAPEFVFQEVFRQDSRDWDGEPSLRTPEFLDWRMIRPKPVKEGYVYEVDGRLYRLDEDFQETELLCDFQQLMGDLYRFSPGTQKICDVTADASKLLACTDEGLYEYDLENGGQEMLEPAYFAHREIVHVEGDCECGERDFEFSGPVKAEYAPDGKSYAFLTGTEEADWGDYTGIVLRSGEGETLYQKEIEEYMGDFRWMESEGAVFLAAFYREDEGTWMDRVDVSTGEKVTFAVPGEVFYGQELCVGFLDADRLLYISDQVSEKWEREEVDKSEFEVYRLSAGERENPEAVGEADWRIMVLNWENGTIPVKYPE